MAEVFERQNHVATIPFRTTNMDAKYMAEIGNWLVWFAKDIDSLNYRQLYLETRDRKETISGWGGVVPVRIDRRGRKTSNQRRKR